jgi:hypothetical protein
MRAFPKAEGFRLFDVNDGVGETRLSARDMSSASFE